MKYLSKAEGLDNVVKVEYNGLTCEVVLDNIPKHKSIVLNDKVYDKNTEVLDMLYISDKTVYLYLDKNGRLNISETINSLYNMRYLLLSKITKKNIYFVGYITNKNNGKFDEVYLNDKKIGEVKRFLKFWQFKHIGMIKVPMKEIEVSNELHNSVRVGKSAIESVAIRTKKTKKTGMQYFGMKRLNGKVVLIRTAVHSSVLRITRIDMQPEYTRLNLLKNKVAKLISKIIGKKDLVLLFEKETKRAEESGYYVFEKIIEKKLDKTKAYFVIDKNSKDYEKIKEKYGKLIVEKYSFRHYLYIYISSYFISSELSNHVINTRLYISSLNDAITKKPLIFLQHGIMFAKPVDNPAAMGFHKNKSQLNIFKNVISSDLEATQFHKMGYDDNDLIKCGLTKFDTSVLDDDADKILFMQTYRYWEEGMINNEKEIVNTTYYKSYMDVIKAFEKANMLEKLRLSCHPKFAQCLVQAAPEYSKIIEPDLTKALREAKVFITDYSSASYDAHYRGAYIIYYWADKEYLIEQYKAIPAIDETNCDGVPVYSAEELVKETKNAISKNYVMDEVYEQRYRRINEFHDGQNGDRLIEELIELEILK